MLSCIFKARSTKKLTLKSGFIIIKGFNAIIIWKKNNNNNSEDNLSLIFNSTKQNEHLAFFSRGALMLSKEAE